MFQNQHKKGFLALQLLENHQVSKTLSVGDGPELAWSTLTELIQVVKHKDIRIRKEAR